MTVSAMKAENSRANFEAWVREEFPVWGKYLLWSESLDAYGYSTTNLMYRAWKASRAEIVVELDKCNCDNGEESVWDDAIEYCEVTLRAAGITVKGD